MIPEGRGTFRGSRFVREHFGFLKFRVSPLGICGFQGFLGWFLGVIGLVTRGSGLIAGVSWVGFLGFEGWLLGALELVYLCSRVVWFLGVEIRPRDTFGFNLEVLMVSGGSWVGL